MREALEAGVGMDALYVEPGADPSVVRECADAGVQVVEVAEGSLRKVLDLVSPRAMVGLARTATSDLGEVVAAAGSRQRPLLGLVGLQDPGNAGTLVRVAEAAGCSGVVLTEGSVDPWNPKVVRASAGALFRVPVASAGATELLGACGSAGVVSVATVPTGGSAPERCDLGGACAILVGAEAAGLPEEVVAAADVRVTLPMEGRVESLNAAVAGSLLAFEAARQRRAGRPGAT